MTHKTAFLNCVDNLKRCASMLKRIEWCSVEQGPGSGPMFSGNDGTRYPACPVCDGIKPGCGARVDFSPEAIGHKPRCSLNKLLKDIGGG